jgi:hypothetical protein
VGTFAANADRAVFPGDEITVFASNQRTHLVPSVGSENRRRVPPFRSEELPEAAWDKQTKTVNNTV